MAKIAKWVRIMDKNKSLYNNDGFIECIRPVDNGRTFKIALFDFDGTLSLIREGWQEIMIPYFCEELISSVDNLQESPEEVKVIVTNFVDILTGKQTIFQCIELKNEIAKRGGRTKAPSDYKQEYLRRLNKKIANRKSGLADGSINQKELLVGGSEEFLTALKNKGIEIFCASGTDEPQVIEEARLLGLDKYFESNIFGALDEEATRCSKELVIKRLLARNNIKGDNLLSFGDGFVEIELVKNAGGYAIAVATDEKNRKGVNPEKRIKLLKAGADAVIPDFGDINALLNLIFPNK